MIQLKDLKTEQQKKLFKTYSLLTGKDTFIFTQENIEAYLQLGFGAFYPLALRFNTTEIPDLTNLILEDLDIPNLDLTNLILPKAEFTGCSFTNLRTTHTIFNEARLHKIRVLSSNLNHLDIANSNVYMYKLFYSQVKDSSYTFCNLDGCSVYFSQLSKVIFALDTFIRGTWDSSSLSQVTFEDCDLTDVEFTECSFEHVKFINCNLTNCRLFNCTVENSTVHNCKSDTTDLPKNSLLTRLS